MRKTAFLAPLTLLWLLTISSSALQAQTPAGNFDVDTLATAVVQVRAPGSNGSGSLLVDGDNVMLLTNRHVVRDQDSVIIAVLLDVNEAAVPMFRAEMMAFSPEHDLALFRVVEDLDGQAVNADMLLSGRHASGYVLPALQLAPPEHVMGRGQTVSILGYPAIGEDELVYTSGIISSVQMGEINGQRVAGWYRTTAEIWPGNSGGIALDQFGQVIGIPTEVYTERATGGRLGGLLPMALALQVLNSDNLLTAWSDYTIPEQGGLRVDGAPIYGEQRINPDNASEHFRHSIVTGGEVDLSQLGGQCVGHAALNPDFMLLVDDNVPDLTLYFIADQIGDDAAMALRDPDGNWFCNDDAVPGTLNPALTITSPLRGEYRLWLASYHAGAYFSGELHIQRAADVELSAATFIREGLDAEANPHFGEVALGAGFTPDPHGVPILSGGATDVSSLGSHCVGHASTQPDLRLHWQGSTENLQVYFVADNAGDDTTLIIQDPDGRWLCNDDARTGTLNPGLELAGSRPGSFAIWVGSYASGEMINGTLYISERLVEVP